MIWETYIGAGKRLDPTVVALSHNPIRALLALQPYTKPFTVEKGIRLLEGVFVDPSGWCWIYAIRGDHGVECCSNSC
ncbi:hypothetical protein AKJ16_DCAP07040 [Drosera capensis]